MREKRAYRLAWFKFYHHDWLCSVGLTSVSIGAKGAAIEALCLCYDMPVRGLFKSNGTAWTVEQLAARMRGGGPHLEPFIEELLGHGVLERNEKGEIYWPRVLRDETRRELDRVRHTDTRRGASKEQRKERDQRLALLSKWIDANPVETTEHLVRRYADHGIKIHIATVRKYRRELEGKAK